MLFFNVFLLFHVDDQQLRCVVPSQRCCKLNFYFLNLPETDWL